VVFFREEPLPDPAVGPRGAQGVPLTPGRSIAVDPRSVPYGTPVWLDSTEPLSSTALQRLVMAQDTGSAITGAVRADYFWGWADGAEAQAGRMKQPLRLWCCGRRACAGGALSYGRLTRTCRLRCRDAVAALKPLRDTVDWRLCSCATSTHSPSGTCTVVKADSCGGSARAGFCVPARRSARRSRAAPAHRRPASVARPPCR